MKTETLRSTRPAVSASQDGASAATAIPWAAVIAGLCASFVGIGLARFAYSPLIPPLIEAHWFAASDVVYLGAANLAGYLVGALMGRPLARRFSNRGILQLMMAVTSLAFFGCAFPVSALWFFCWRFASGVAGGAIMVLVAATVLPHIPAARRGMASGAIFMGAGMGIAASGTVIPLLLELGLRQAWIGLGVLSVLLTAISWQGWPDAIPAAAPAPVQTGSASRKQGLALKVLYGEYALMAIGLVPMMLFLVDFVARGLGRGAHAGSMYWVLYGLGAIIGPVCYGFIADRVKFGPALRGMLLLQAVVTALCAVSGDAVLLGIASVLIGMFPPGIAPLMLGRLHEMMPNHHAGQNIAWSRATIVFALFQALSAYGYSFLFNRSGGDYPLIFAIGAAALALAFAADMLMAAVSMRGARLPGGAVGKRC
ncbi:YbfB/YjiJ family MFS transporter [Undibacterium sp.]|uniref:YbfB/YjiJ family MFS transporter n=1 Tax=Undibacterium sp. TaxID=1914977 RepID=UPI002C712B99|nr:YbfB/YjiJ family MFS transporter [Undibacterium sp.]HTD05116.1 YbfB/YjiJ family MFS transporter [Undibacterium sp.]